VVIAATDVGALDDRENREAQLAAGLVEGRPHPLAARLGAGARGVASRARGALGGGRSARAGCPRSWGSRWTACCSRASVCRSTGRRPAARRGRRPRSARSRRACRIRARKRHPGAEHETRSGCPPAEPHETQCPEPPGAGRAIVPEMETWDALRARRNVRTYEDRAIPDDDLDRILEAGRRTPSSMNQQAWDFVVVSDRD